MRVDGHVSLSSFRGAGSCGMHGVPEIEGLLLASAILALSSCTSFHRCLESFGLVFNHLESSWKSSSGVWGARTCPVVHGGRAHDLFRPCV